MSNDLLTSKNGRLKKEAHVSQLTRGQVAAQEQMRILREVATAAANKGEAQIPQTRGQVAAQEQMRILKQAMATSKGEPRASTTRGEVAAQEQIGIISKLTGNFVQNRKPVEAK
jgi:hypothetical protein